MGLSIEKGRKEGSQPLAGGGTRQGRMAMS